MSRFARCDHTTVTQRPAVPNNEYMNICYSKDCITVIENAHRFKKKKKTLLQKPLRKLLQKLPQIMECLVQRKLLKKISW